MKKFLLVVSMICFAISMVLFCLCESLWVALITTLLLGGAIVLTIYLMRKNARWWLVIVVLLVALSILTSSITAWSASKTINSIPTLQQQVEVHDEQEEVETDNNEVVAPDQVYHLKKEDSDKTVSPNATETETSEQTIETVKTVVVEKIKEVPVEVQKVVEVPVEVEKIVEVEKPVVVEKVKEVPVVQYIEKEPEKTTTAQTQTQTNSNTTTSTSTPPKYSYTGDPTTMNYGYNNGYGYDYGNPYYGDPTTGYGYGCNNYSTNVQINGPTSVTAGGSYVYTVYGASGVYMSNFILPDNVNGVIIGANQVRLTFAEGWVGAYSIGYGNASISVRVNA